MSVRAARKQCLAVALAYAVGIVAPWLHALLEVETECTECEQLLEHGPWVEASCDGGEPCQDPTHHHHHGHGHNHGQCPVCQTKLHGVESGIGRRDLVIASALADRPVCRVGAVSRLLAYTPPVRGPPPGS